MKHVWILLAIIVIVVCPVVALAVGLGGPDF